jgi:hypothetical protein
MPDVIEYRAEKEAANQAAKEAIRAQLIAAAATVVEAASVEVAPVVETAPAWDGPADE